MSTAAYKQLAANPYRPWSARITSITELTDKEKLFEFRLIDEDVREAFQFDAGQFVEVSIFGVGEAPISISSAPSKQGFIELCVRQAGDVTSALHHKQCGDIVGLRGPFGRGFPFEEMKGHDVLLVAGGLGIAPLKSLINHIHDERHDFGRVTILLGAKNPSEKPFSRVRFSRSQVLETAPSSGSVSPPATAGRARALGGGRPTPTPPLASVNPVQPPLAPRAGLVYLWGGFELQNVYEIRVKS